MSALQLDLSNNLLCGRRQTGDEASDRDYIAEGIKAIADALKDNGSLTRLNVEYNALGDEGWAVIHSAVQGKGGFDLSHRGEYE